MDGATLRRARNAKQLTLEQVAERTKVSVSVLKALENNDVDRLPARVYARGFLRAYAKEVGLDPGETVNEYFQQFEDEPSIGLADDADSGASRDLQVEPETRRGLPVGTLAAVALLAGAIYFVFVAPRTSSSRTDRAAASATRGDAAPAATTPQPPPAPAVAPAVAVQTEPVDGLRVDLAAQGECWISATADGKQAVARLFKPGEQHTIDATNQLVLRVGDPGALKLSINGAAGRPLGAAGQPVTVQITRDNFRDFLAQ
jgi:cytoskeleton protein RodZ